jgi:putative integral membrane protein (TIGR02587 family)
LKNLFEKAAEPDANRRYAVDLARAGGGAIIFSLPILMTVEVWWLGFTIDRWRLALFTLLALPVLVALSYYIGFEDTIQILDDILDAFAAYAVGFVASALILYLFAVIHLGMPVHELAGKVAVQAVTASLGAMFAHDLLGAEHGAERIRRTGSYHGQLFLMGVGAIFLCLSVAPTEEVLLISHQMSEWHTAALLIATLVMMHAFVYAVEFHGQVAIPEESSSAVAFLRFTVAGYAIALLISFYILWTFGRFDGMAGQEAIKAAIVLGFPAGLGAAAVRLIL